MAKRKMVRLLAPEGTDEANFGEERFRVDNDGYALVPTEAVDALIATGGFTHPEPDDEEAGPTAPEGSVLLYHPEGLGCSFGGVSYEPDDNGAVSVPAHAAKDLVTHGFTVTPPKA